MECQMVREDKSKAIPDRPNTLTLTHINIRVQSYHPSNGNMTSALALSYPPVTSLNPLFPLRSDVKEALLTIEHTDITPKTAHRI